MMIEGRIREYHPCLCAWSRFRKGEGVWLGKPSAFGLIASEIKAFGTRKGVYNVCKDVYGVFKASHNEFINQF